MSRSRSLEPEDPSRPLLPIQYLAASFHISNEVFEIWNIFYRTSETNKEKYAFVMGRGPVCFNTKGRFMPLKLISSYHVRH
jgi:hypothetical protein